MRRAGDVLKRELPSPARFAAWGGSLREIDPSTLAADPEDGPVRWFLGDGGCEIFVWLDPDGAAHHAQLILGSVTLDWSSLRGLSTASFVDGGSILGGRHDGYLLKDGTRDDGGVLSAARALLEGASVGGGLFAPILGSLRSVLDDPALTPPAP